MPNLQFELDQLALASRHIQAAEENIARMRTRISEERSQRVDTTESERALQVALETLSALVMHRDLISRMIDDIQSGRLPST